MSLCSEQQIRSLFDASWQAAFVITGGGISALNELLSHSGASGFVLEAQVPYHPAALKTYLGSTPESFCSEGTARQLAREAFKRAENYYEPSAQPLGISCTAALQTVRERRGSDRAFFGFVSAKTEQVFSIQLPEASRFEQEQRVGKTLLEHLFCFVEENDL